MGSRKTETKLTSAAAFVEGGIQDSCDDACSICLEEFCESDPSTVTTCKHDFHLQCILEWCQRSSQCPMCWQSISLKDPRSQELLEAVEHERTLRIAASRNATTFHHPTLGSFGLQRLPTGLNNADIEELIIQRLAAATAMGRAPCLGRREELSSTSTPHGPFSASESRSEPEVIPVGSPSTPLTANCNELAQHISHLQTRSSSLAFGSTNTTTTHQESYSNNGGSKSHSSPTHLDQAGPSEFQSFSESMRSKFQCVSTRYRDSISRGTRGWKERLFSRNSSVSDIGSEVRRELNVGIASLSRLMERLETRENKRDGGTSVSNRGAHSSIAESSNQNNA